MIINKKNGFSLIEVMIAISMIFVGAIGLVKLLTFTVNSNRISANQLIAANLAQEAIEVVRNDRNKDSSWSNWYSSISDGDYIADINTSNYNWSLNSGSGFYDLYYDNTDGLYNHSSGDPTIFSRKITINALSPSEKQIIVEISWSEKNKSHSFISESRLHKWLN